MSSTGRRRRSPKGDKLQTIFRNASRDKPFTLIPNAVLRDPDLSPAAGWVLVLVLSLPPDWKVHREWVSDNRRMKRDRTQAAINELIARGYARRHQVREKDGTLGAYEYQFTDTPGMFDGPEPENPVSAGPQNGGSPKPVLPAPVKQQLQRLSQSQRQIDTKKERARARAGRASAKQRLGTDNSAGTASAGAQRSACAERTLGSPGGDGGECLPISALTEQRIRVLGEDPAHIVDRCRTKARTRIRDWDAYALRVATEEHEKRTGVSARTARGLWSRSAETRKRAIAAVTGLAAGRLSSEDNTAAARRWLAERLGGGDIEKGLARLNGLPDAQ